MIREIGISNCPDVAPPPTGSRDLNRSPNCIANCALASAQAMGGFFHLAVRLRNASQISLVAASSLGKCPLFRIALRTPLCRLSMALVV